MKKITSKKEKSEKTLPFSASAIGLQAVLASNSEVHLSIIPPEGKDRSAVDICAVIDVSGSMNDEAALVGKSEKTYLSVLDVVKHAVRTIFTALRKEDRFGIVAYSTEAKVALELTSMTEDGKKKAEEALGKLTPEGHTNLWGGLKNGLDLISKNSRKNVVSSIMLLTDGMPNIMPEDGHLENLKKYKNEKNLNCIINTFGFGYSLNSTLLNDLAILGNGSYAFIPDSSFVGTIFINSLSNLLSTCIPKMTLELKPENSTKILNIPSLPKLPENEIFDNSSPVDVELDLVFCVDCTGSMGSYISEAQKNIKLIIDKIITSERANVRFALVSYRDHPPQEKTYITQVFNFSNEQEKMKNAVDTMAASGGGDTPEAVTTGLSDSLKLDYRPNSTKVVILVADAPPHGLGATSSGDKFPEGEPNGLDPLVISREMAKKGIALYTVGCEPEVLRTERCVSFMRSIAAITGGKYVPLSDYNLLSNAIIGSCREELSLFRVALPVLKLYEECKGDVGEVVKRSGEKGLLVNSLNFDDNNEEKYKKEVQVFLESENLKEFRKKFGNTKGITVDGGKVQVTVNEGSMLTVAQVQKIVKKFSGQKTHLEELEQKKKKKWKKW